jgi:hypothetical protein
LDDKKNRIEEINKYIREINDAYYKDGYSYNGVPMPLSQTHLFDYRIVCEYDPVSQETVETTYFTQDSAAQRLKQLLQDGVCAWIKQEK